MDADRHACTVLQGVGVGRGARRRTGRPGAARAAPCGRTRRCWSTGSRRTSRRRTRAVEAAFADVAAGLREQAGAATGTVADVLAATAQMADDPALRARGAGARSTRASPPVSAVDARRRRCSRRCSSRPAATWPSASPTCARVRDRVVARLLGLPDAGRARADRARRSSSPRTWRPPTPRRSTWPTSSRSSPSWAARPATPRSSPASSGLPCVVRVAGATSLDDGTDVAVDAAAGTVTLDPDDDRRAEVVRARAAVETRAGVGHRTRRAPPTGTPSTLLANIGTAEDAERVAGGGVEGVGLFRTEVLFLETRDGADAGRAGRGLRAACCGRSATARSSSARSTPAPTSRWRSPRSPTRRTRRSACAATGWCGRTRSCSTPSSRRSPARRPRPARRRGSWRR